MSDDVTYEQRVKKEQVGWVNAVNNHHAAALVYTGKASWLASPWVFWLCHLLLPLALPYRMWLSASTGKCAVTIKKRIRCRLRQNPSERGEEMGKESVSESELDDVCLLVGKSALLLAILLAILLAKV